MAKLTETGHDENSLRSRVYSRLQDDILNGIYAAGENLAEMRLSEELGVSRTPIREALRQLELEGLVQAVPNKGVFVTGITEKDIDEIYDIRVHIEGLAARWAAERILPEELQELLDAVDLEEFYTGKNDLENLLRLDSKIHKLIFRAGKSNPLIFMLGHFHDYIKKARNMSLSVPGRPAESLKEHKAIIDAIRDHDSAAAEKFMIAHIRNARRNIRT